MTKKAVLTLLIFFAITGIPIANALAENTQQPLAGKIIVIDPGHGGYDPGAIWGEIYEKHINLDISQRVKKLLEGKGAKVLLTRTGDYNYALVGQRGIEAKRYDLQKRVEIANSNSADILLTIHVNSCSETYCQGAETFYYINSQQGKLLALAIQQELRTIPGMNKRVAKVSNCYMIRCSKMPAVLVEVGYLSNKQERELLQNPQYLGNIAEKITTGVLEYFIAGAAGRCS